MYIDYEIGFKINDSYITHRAHWTEFVHLARLVDMKSETLSANKVKYLKEDLLQRIPSCNRDTLAFLMLHLKQVAESHACQMNIKNLARIFGPTVVGHSSSRPGALQVVEETNDQQLVVRMLLMMPANAYLELLDCTAEDLDPRRQKGNFAGIKRTTPPLFENIVPNTSSAASFLATPARLAHKARSKFFPSFNRHLPSSPGRQEPVQSTTN
ncbi:hypothetical protein Ciccas_001491 [Cichlidogyrus casuarinus]|uniref:Rho-GAP domain-containing protein n=1 Tax=Cichlidogyrus casuarinus TaxID=1844966 RepID=A0ABD2QJX0_9PLAT